ncbi:MAG TPA: A24 family peptidase [Acidimicrobiales bacterium]|nr:A24 family peptidase [Acidimicrobiales bacterium]
MHAAVTIVLALLGVPVGALLNVVIDRVPDRVPLRGPREGEPADPVHLGPVPLQPWLLRAGGRDHLPRRWLWVELTTVAVLAVVGLRAGDDLRVVPLALLGAALVAVTVIDLQLLRIPDRVTFPTLAVSVPLVAAVSLRYDGGEAFVGGLIGMVTYFVALLVPHLVYPKGMGFGDVKLALLMGLHLGWLGWEPEHPVAGPVSHVLYGLMLGCVLGVVFGIGHQVVTRRRGEFPFGPALALACLVVALA